MAIVVALLTLSPTVLADDDWSLDLGPGVAVFPKYPGARAEHIWPIPTIDARYDDWLFFNTRHGLGICWVDQPALQLGTSLWFRPGRHHDDGDTVSHLDDIKTAGKAQLFASTLQGPLFMEASLAQDLGGSKGLTLDATVAWRVALTERLHASLGVTGSFASAKFMQTWFGISAEQSAASGLPEYSPHAGVKSVGPAGTWKYVLSSRWSLNGAITYDRLTGQAADSPVVERWGLPTVSLGFVRHFAP